MLNNPMTYTDPSGYFIKNIFKALAKVPLLDQIVSVAVSIFAVATAQPWLISVYQGLKTYALTGSLGAGLRAFVISDLTMFATAGMSNYIGANVTDLGLNVMAHSAVGGVMSVVQGGKFGHGFISSMVSTSMKMFMEPQTGTFADAVKRTTIASIVGGTVSAITGGKFANGAITSAMQWWYNAEGNPTTLDKYLEDNGEVDYIDEDSAKILREAEAQRKFQTKYDNTDGNKWDSSETDCSGSLTNILHRAGLRDGYKNGRLTSGDINSKNGFIKVKELAPGDILVWRGHVACLCRQSHDLHNI